MSDLEGLCISLIPLQRCCWIDPYSTAVAEQGTHTQTQKNRKHSRSSSSKMPYILAYSLCWFVASFVFVIARESVMNPPQTVRQAHDETILWWLENSIYNSVVPQPYRRTAICHGLQLALDCRCCAVVCYSPPLKVSRQGKILFSSRIKKIVVHFKINL